MGKDDRAALGFYLGEYLEAYRHRHQVQVATRLLVETRLSLTTIAKVVALSEAKLAQVYQARTGEFPRPSSHRLTLSTTAISRSPLSLTNLPP